MGLLRDSGTATEIRAVRRPCGNRTRISVAVPESAALLLAMLCCTGASAIETDQFYAWGRTIEDSTEVLNARVNLGIEEALASANAEPARERLSCEDVVRRVVSRFRYVIFWEPELWAMNSGLVARVPATREENALYARTYLYANTSFADNVRRMPPSPTVEAAGVRFGTDKLTHFFSEGHMQHRWRLEYLREGHAPEEAERRAIRRGIFVERTLLGMTSSGVFSPADLEANDAGMRFYDSLCDASSPRLLETDAGWRLDRPFDLRDHVTPRWDESWQPNAFSERRWRKVLPSLRAYCPLLEDEGVRARRAAYLVRDRETPTERVVRDLVRRGKLPDPSAFSIDAVCRSQVSVSDLNRR